MLKQHHKFNIRKHIAGFSFTEVVIASAIVSVIGSVAYPHYNNAIKNAKFSEAKAKTLSIPPIISAFIDATGEAPETWDDLSSIATVMTSNGPATGDLNSPIILANTEYVLSVTGPINSIYTLTATTSLTESSGKTIQDRYSIKSCFNVSNGASDITRGSGTGIANTPNCG